MSEPIPILGSDRLSPRSGGLPAGDDSVPATRAEHAKAHPQGLRETKTLLARDLVRNIDDNAEEMATTSARLFGSDAAREAMLAFLSRKK